MAFQRRRHHERCPIPPLPAAKVLSAAALILLSFLAILSFIAPSLPRHPSLPISPSHAAAVQHQPALVKSPIDVQRNLVGVAEFRVPSGGGKMDGDIWGAAMAKYYYGCSNASRGFAAARDVTVSNRYLMIATSGGLNQQRTGITDAVVAARILNATLVVPKLDYRSFWKDDSNFSEIFDVDWFISFLSRDVKIIEQLPVKGGKAIRSPYTMRVPRKCTASCYQKRVLPNLLKKHVVQLTKFDYRLANKLNTDLQKLRCKVNYHALKFTDPILMMGEKLIQRMKSKCQHFIALHLRFEPDMLAFSRCYYGGGDKERKELGAIRRRWKTLHASNPDKQGRQGRCPLTPEEVGLMLRALGFGKDVHIYVASGEVYGGEQTLAPLKTVFPNIHSKETLASKKELAPFSTFSSRMAALDYMVCDGSDVFVTNNNGNMAKMLAGRRRYFGHKRTIRPNAKKLYPVFLNRTSMSWEEFASKVRIYQKGFMGEPNELRPGRGDFHENPSSCICEHAEAKTAGKNERGNLSKSIIEPLDAGYEEPDLFDLDYGESTPLGKDSLNKNESDYDLNIKPDDPEFDEIFSD